MKLHPEISLKSFRPRKQWLLIFFTVALLSSIPNLGNFVDETICASGPCQMVRLQNPIPLPYSWLFVEKKCNYCNIGSNAFTILYENSFPLIPLLNIIVGISYILILATFIDFGLTQIRKHKNRTNPKKSIRTGRKANSPRKTHYPRLKTRNPPL
jgi:hypothetical protein